MAVMEQISPELVLVDPELAALERPRERVVSLPVQAVVPIGVPLLPREQSAAKPVWVVGALGLALLAAGLVLAWVLFREAPGSGRPTVVPTLTAPSPAEQSRFVGPPLPHPSP